MTTVRFETFDVTELTDPKQKLLALHRRLWVAMACVLLAFLLLFVRLYYLQVHRYDYFHAKAEGNRIALLPIVPQRGIIMDRRGRVLARNYTAYTLEIDPLRVNDLAETIQSLSEIVDIDERDRRRFFKQLEEGKFFESVALRTHLSEAEVARIVARRYRYPGVEVYARLFRDYPYGAVGSHVIGYIGRINEKDIGKIEERGETANYRGSEYIGRSGLELSYESTLHGQTGVEQVEVNASGRAVRLMSYVPATAGQNLQLTLDIELQRAAESAFGGRRGALVAIDPATGGVLALVSMPDFDPNLFVDGISVPDWKALNESPDHPLLNRAIRSPYPPGSTFKPFMAMAGLESGKRTVGKKFNNQGVFSFPGHTYIDRKSKCQNGVDVHRSLVYSCNVYYYELAHDLGITAIADFMKPFGFGHKTDIDIPGEAAGVLPSPTWKRAHFSRKEQKVWYGGETLSIGIGQGYNAYTPLQMANALATLVNGGMRHRPHLVDFIVDGRSQQKSVPEGKFLGKLPLTPAFVEAVRNAMVDVVEKGTSARAFAGASYRSGGKTGTAQVFSLHGRRRYNKKELNERLIDHSWYISFAPAEQPEIVLAVLVENGGYGSKISAPIAREVLDFYFEKLKPSANDIVEEAATMTQPEVRYDR